MKTIIFGIGNPYRCDDNAGLKVIEELQLKIHDPDIVIKSGSIDGLSLLDEINGYKKVIIVDSIKTENGTPGDIRRIELETDKKNPVSSLSHGIVFINALQVSSDLGYKLPKKITVFAIEIMDNLSFNEECTEPVKAAIPKAVKIVIDELKR